MTSSTMSLSDMAREVGVSRQAVARWHRRPGKIARETTHISPLRSVAEAMGIEVPEADAARPRYPRSVFVAYCQAVGLMDEEGNLVPEIQERIAQRKPGRWTPVAPTLQPGKGSRRRRYYAAHVAKHTGLEEQSISYYAAPVTGRSFPAPDGHDEMDRPFWFLETFQRYRTMAQRQARRQPADQPAPSSPDED
ncbi:helix-turn-helix domain-containing protein [Streptomyces californicus]|uniref:helix-turn-helix domain-containing protein n=1 Tax=Streptomyces californicus TaxID=67351 RepID=UPI003723426C